MAEGNGKVDEHEVESPDIHFEPIIRLEKVDIATMEEDEEELIQLRAKLFRYDISLEPAEWKERGTGTVKLLKHRSSGLIRILMRRDKTLKVCCNHYVTPEMNLQPNSGSDKAWVWSTNTDFSDDEVKHETLAIRFKNAEIAQQWKAKFLEAQEAMKEAIPKHNASLQSTSPAGKQNGTSDAPTSDSPATQGSGDSDTKQSEDTTETDKVADKLEQLSVKQVSKDGDNSTSTQDNKTDDEKTQTSEGKD